MVNNSCSFQEIFFKYDWIWNSSIVFVRSKTKISKSCEALFKFSDYKKTAGKHAVYSSYFHSDEWKLFLMLEINLENFMVKLKYKQNRKKWIRKWKHETKHKLHRGNLFIPKPNTITAPYISQTKISVSEMLSCIKAKRKRYIFPFFYQQGQMFH